jgi:hypothetical protein
MAMTPRVDLRPGVTEPVILMISRRQVESADIASVLTKLKPFLAAREDAWLYRGQMSLVVDGYNEDAREIVDIPEVRTFLQLLNEHWPYWAFFFNQVDDSIKLLGCCVCGANFPGNGVIEIDGAKLVDFLRRGFGGMNFIFEKFGFPEDESKTMGDGLLEVIEQSGLTTPF